MLASWPSASGARCRSAGRISGKGRIVLAGFFEIAGEEEEPERHVRACFVTAGVSGTSYADIAPPAAEGTPVEPEFKMGYADAGGPILRIPKNTLGSLAAGAPGFAGIRCSEVFSCLPRSNGNDGNQWARGRRSELNILPAHDLSHLSTASWKHLSASSVAAEKQESEVTAGGNSGVLETFKHASAQG